MNSLAVEKRRLHLNVISVNSSGVVMEAEDVYTIINRSSSINKRAVISVDQTSNDLRVFSSSGREFAYSYIKSTLSNFHPQGYCGRKIRIFLPKEFWISQSEKSILVLRYTVRKPPLKFGSFLVILNLLPKIFLFSSSRFLIHFCPWFAKYSEFSVSSNKEPRIRTLYPPKYSVHNGVSIKTKTDHGNYFISWTNNGKTPINTNKIPYYIPMKIEPDILDVLINVLIGYTIIAWGLIGPFLLFRFFIGLAMTLTQYIEGLFGIVLLILTYSLVPANEALIKKKPVIIIASISLFVFSLVLLGSFFFYSL